VLVLTSHGYETAVKDGSPRNLSDDNLTIIANALGLSETDLRYRNKL
jgi:microsomal dipeptidase-like Zn-dependent dipeptidase